MKRGWAHPHSGGQRPKGAGHRPKRKFIMGNGITLSTAQGSARAHTHAHPPEAHKGRPKGVRLRALDSMSAFLFLPLFSV